MTHWCKDWYEVGSIPLHAWEAVLHVLLSSIEETITGKQIFDSFWHFAWQQWEFERFNQCRDADRNVSRNVSRNVNRKVTPDVIRDVNRYVTCTVNRDVNRNVDCKTT